MRIKLALFFICFYIFSTFSLSQNYPQRIISLGPSLTEQLYILGVQDKLIANTIYCERPPDAKNKEKVGTVVDVNIEKIISLRPDLVLATSLTSPKDIKKLKNLGIRVEIFSYSKSFSHMCDDFLRLARLVGREEKAKKILNKTKEEVEKIKRKTKYLKKQKVIVQVGTNPLWVAIKKSLINDFVELAGGINLGPEGKTGIYSREEVLKQNPDVIIIVEMGIAGEREKEIWEKYKTINAVKNKRIYIFDSYKLCSPTPVSFPRTLREIAILLHPELRNRKEKILWKN